MFTFGDPPANSDFSYRPNYDGAVPDFRASPPRKRQRTQRWKLPAHSRPLLQGQRQSTPEQMEGMIAAKFTADVSDEEPDEPRAVSQWSNPDPYTALPPPDGKRSKDVVKLIRKARIADDMTADDGTADDGAADDNGITANDDFISLGFEPGVLGAPTGPRFSHLNSFHGTALVDRTPNEALGSRKRTYDDRIKSPPREFKKGRKWEHDGRIIDDWDAADNPYPWLRTNHAKSMTVSFWLHKEIYDFYDFVRPTVFEESVRHELVNNLTRLVRAKLPHAAVYAFGSFASGLYLPCADMDLVLISDGYMSGHRGKQYDNKRDLYKFRDLLERNNLAVPGSIELVIGAKVPLVKYVDRVTQLKVDLSFENLTGITALDTIKAWVAEFPALPAVIAVVKQYLAMRGLNEVYTGGLGGFSTICLVVSLLQLLPQAQSKSLPPHFSLSELLMEFFDLYGNEFDYLTAGIRLDRPGYFNKSILNAPYRGNGARLCILDPNNRDNDISGGSAEVGLIFRCFRDSYDHITQLMGTLNYAEFEERSGKSILGAIIGGDYRRYATQRNIMRRLDETLAETRQTFGTLYQLSDQRLRELVGTSQPKAVKPPLGMRKRAKKVKNEKPKLKEAKAILLSSPANGKIQETVDDGKAHKRRKRAKRQKEVKLDRPKPKKLKKAKTVDSR